MPMQHLAVLKARQCGLPAGRVHAAFTGAPLTTLHYAGAPLHYIGPAGRPARCSRPGRGCPHESCLTKAEQRAAVTANKAISLAQAIKVLRQHRQYSEVVRARLCRHDQKLVYVLTLLGRSGKVVTATIDAVNGEYQLGRSAEK